MDTAPLAALAVAGQVTVADMPSSVSAATVTAVGVPVPWAPWPVTAQAVPLAETFRNSPSVMARVAAVPVPLAAAVAVSIRVVVPPASHLGTYCL